MKSNGCRDGQTILAIKAHKQEGNVTGKQSEQTRAQSITVCLPKHRYTSVAATGHIYLLF